MDFAYVAVKMSSPTNIAVCIILRYIICLMSIEYVILRHRVLSDNSYIVPLDMLTVSSRSVSVYTCIYARLYHLYSRMF